MSNSTALTVITPEEQAYLDSLNSGGAASEGTGPKRLSINIASKDSDGVKRTVGAWHIEGTDKYFDGTVKFRPVRYVNKLIRYTEGQNGDFTFAGHSVYFTDFREEIIDSTGGLALGRKFGKELRSLPESEQEANKKLAGTYADVFGLVTFGDTDPVPCVLRVRGGKLKAILDAFNSVPKDKRYSQYNFDLETYQETDEKTKKVKAYWSIKVTPDMSQVLPITPILAFDGSVMDYIRDTNHQVLEQHKKNRAKLDNKTAGDGARVINAALLDDELPF